MPEQIPTRPNGYHNGEGASSTVVGAMDMASASDRGTLRRWGVDAPKKERYLRALDAALSMAIDRLDHRAMAGIVRTLVLIEGQNQSDEHLNRKMAAGMSADGVLRVVIERNDAE